MAHIDLRGNAITGANDEALSAYERALAAFQTYCGNPFAEADQAIRLAPGFAMAYCLKAYLFLCGTESAALGDARACLAAALAANGNDREKAHAATVADLIAGEFERASERLEDILVDHPRDALAIQVAHVLDFLRGDARNLRDRVARRFHAWSAADPGYHALLGMYAFGLEENGDYARAEETGRRALDLNPRDTWAHHAVAHVMEMQGRREDGIAWMEGREKLWAEDSFFAVHNWWHLALFNLDLDRNDRALALYDGPIRGTRSSAMLDLIDASALLWRVHLRGIDVSSRFAELAEAWAPFAEHRYYAFNDVHAMLAFVGAGRMELAERTLASLRRALSEGGSNRAMVRDVGLPLAEALHAFGRQDYARAAVLLRPLRPIAHRFGGSNAQRDLIDLTLLETAARSGQRPLLTALAAERLATRPRPHALAFRYRGALPGGAAHAA